MEVSAKDDINCKEVFEKALDLLTQQINKEEVVETILTKSKSNIYKDGIKSFPYIGLLRTKEHHRLIKCKLWFENDSIVIEKEKNSIFEFQSIRSYKIQKIWRYILMKITN